ncbi:RABL3-like protein [Mya arenaria]|uniref:RABL3-like protein n=1 Tax=Mya arenaria TaxID=6604 RepID=A0ABY7EGY0_MYAAR|nr:RABL3-like protein [Mya arenaria]
MANVDKVKILVVGDSGVGKTSLVHLICHNEPTNSPGWTIGCSVDVKAGTAAEKTFFVELWDIGGCTGHQNSRSIFYNPVHGIILVHDLTNRKSQQNLRSWLAEVLKKDNKSSGNGQIVKYLAPGSTNAVKLSRFFDKVIERRYYSRSRPKSRSLQSTTREEKM